MRIIAPFSGGTWGTSTGSARPSIITRRFDTAPRPGPYKIVSRLPVELEGRLLYRIKSADEKFERTVDESDLSPAD